MGIGIFGLAFIIVLVFFLPLLQTFSLEIFLFRLIKLIKICTSNLNSDISCILVENMDHKRY